MLRLTTTLPTLAFATEIQDLGFSGGTPGTPCHISKIGRASCRERV